MTNVHYEHGRSRQVEIHAGFRSFLGANAIYLSELREAVRITEDWPEHSRVRVEKSALVGDRLKITDTRKDWTDE